MLRPADIEHHQFGTTRLREGYDQDEVDSFLDQVGADYAEFEKRIATLQEELKRSRRVAIDDTPTQAIPLVTSASPMGSAEKILVLAQKTADQHIADAEAQAAEMVRAAGGQGARLVDEAQKQADVLVGDAKARADVIINEGYAEKAKRLSELEAQHGQVSAALEQLRGSGTTVRKALQDALIAYDQEVPQ